MKTFLIVAGFADSLIGFRLPFLKNLIACGFEVHAAAPEINNNERARDLLLSLGVQVHEYPLSRTGLNPLADFHSLFNLYKLMHKIKPDYFMAYTLKPVVYGSIAAWLSGVKNRFALITGLGQSFQEDDKNIGVLERFLGILLKFSLKHVDTVLFQNPDDAKLFIRRGIISQDRPIAVVNGSGVDVEEYSFQQVPEEKLSFLFVARLLESKGVKVFADAGIRIRSAFPNVEFRIAGWIDGSSNSISTEDIMNWEKKGIVYLGKLDDVRPALSDASVFVLPTFYREGTPRSILEALSVGRAVITTDTPGCRETVVNGVNGFLVDPKSVSDLEKAMLYFVENAAEAKRMGAASREIASEKYDVRLVNASMLAAMGIS